MAYYFLAESPSYLMRTDRKIIRRREVVSEHLKEDYKVRRGTDEEVFQQIKERLDKEGIEVTESTYCADKTTIRQAYLWLAVTDPNEKKAIPEKNKIAKAAIDCLTQDGILSWDDIQHRQGGSAEQTEESKVTSLAELKRFSLADHAAGREALEQFELLVGKLQDMLEENQIFRDEIERLHHEQAELAGKLTDADKYIELVENENSVLEVRLAEAKTIIRNARGDSLETIAKEHPEVPQLYAIAQSMKKNQGSLQAKMEFLANRLPKSFHWQNETGALEYRLHFLRRLAADFTETEIEATIEQLKTFCSQGPEYPSLYTKKLAARALYSPPDCFASRASGELRFTWKKNGNIVVFWIYRRGDSRIRQSEQ